MNIELQGVKITPRESFLKAALWLGAKISIIINVESFGDSSFAVPDRKSDMKAKDQKQESITLEYFFMCSPKTFDIYSLKAVCTLFSSTINDLLNFYGTERNIADIVNLINIRSFIVSKKVLTVTHIRLLPGDWYTPLTLGPNFLVDRPYILFNESQKEKNESLLELMKEINNLAETLENPHYQYNLVDGHGGPQLKEENDKKLREIKTREHAKLKMREMNERMKKVTPESLAKNATKK